MPFDNSLNQEELGELLHAVWEPLLPLVQGIRASVRFYGRVKGLQGGRIHLAWYEALLWEQLIYGTTGPIDDATKQAIRQSRIAYPIIRRLPRRTCIRIAARAQRAVRKHR